MRGMEPAATFNLLSLRRDQLVEQHLLAVSRLAAAEAEGEDLATAVEEMEEHNWEAKAGPRPMLPTSSSSSYLSSFYSSSSCFSCFPPVPPHPPPHLFPPPPPPPYPHQVIRYGTHETKRGFDLRE